MSEPTRFYLSMECDRCEEDIFYGPVLSLLTHNGLPVIPFDFASHETFDCEHCGTEHHLGDFDMEVEPGQIPGEDTETDE